MQLAGLVKLSVVHERRDGIIVRDIVICMLHDRPWSLNRSSTMSSFNILAGDSHRFSGALIVH